MATAKSPWSQWDERDKFQEDAIHIIERYYQHPAKDAYSITGQIYDDLVRPLKQHGTEPLQMLLAASMLVQRLKQVIGEWRASKVPIAKVMGAEIQDLLDEFAEDSKGSTGSGNSSIIQHKR